MVASCLPPDYQEDGQEVEEMQDIEDQGRIYTLIVILSIPQQNQLEPYNFKYVVIGLFMNML